VHAFRVSGAAILAQSDREDAEVHGGDRGEDGGGSSHGGRGPS
jgi:hypothetical protein